MNADVRPATMKHGIIEALLSAVSSSFTRAIAFVVVVVLGFQGGCASHTVPLYHTHVPIWDYIRRGFWVYVLALPFCLALAVKADSRLWTLVAFLGALMLSFFMGWLTVCAFS